MTYLKVQNNDYPDNLVFLVYRYQAPPKHQLKYRKDIQLDPRDVPPNRQHSQAHLWMSLNTSYLCNVLDTVRYMRSFYNCEICKRYYFHFLHYYYNCFRYCCYFPQHYFHYYSVDFRAIFSVLLVVAVSWYELRKQRDEVPLPCVRESVMSLLWLRTTVLTLKDQFTMFIISKT